MTTLGEIARAEADVLEDHLGSLETMYLELGHSAVVDVSTADKARALYERALTSIINSGIVIDGLSENSGLGRASFAPREGGQSNSERVVLPLDDLDIRRIEGFQPVYFSISVPGIKAGQDVSSREVQPRIFFRHGQTGYDGVLGDIEWHRAEQAAEVAA